MEQDIVKISGNCCLIVLVAVMWSVILSCDTAWSYQVRKALTSFNAPGIIHFTGNSRIYDINVPVPERWLVDSARLTISYINSAELFSDLSQMVVLVNGYPVAQTRLYANAPEGRMEVVVPGRLFKTGYNRIRFLIAQTESNEPCTRPDQPEVWTDIKFFESYLDMTFTLKEVPLSLASIGGFLYDPRMYGENHVHIVMEKTTPEYLELAMLAASGISVRFDYRPVRFSLGNTLENGMDTVLIGSREFIEATVRKYAPDFEARGDLGMFYGVMPDPLHKDILLPDRRHGLVYIKGGDMQELVRNTRAFALVSWPMPDMAECEIESVTLPEITRYSGKRLLAPDREYAFRELDWHTTTFHGYRPLPSDMSFMIPSDLELPGNRDAELYINMAYASKMREDSVLSILLNNKYVASIPLDNETGAIYRGYRVRIPASYFNKGFNILTFSPVLVPFHTGECELTESEHLALTIKDDSTIMLPGLQHWTALPDLENVFDDGFPLTISPDFRDTCLLLGSDDPSVMEAALDFVSMISQKKGIPAFRLVIAREPDDRCRSREILAIGQWKDIPSDILDVSSLKPELLMPFNGRLPGTLRDISWFDRLKERYAGIPLPVMLYTPDTGRIRLDTDFRQNGSNLLIAQFESPYRAMRSVVLVTAASPERLLYGVKQLYEPEVRNFCQKAVTVIEFSGKKPRGVSIMSDRIYFAGSRSAKHWLDYFVSRHFMILVISLLFFMAAVSLVLVMALKRRKRRKLKEYE